MKNNKNFEKKMLIPPVLLLYLAMWCIFLTGDHTPSSKYSFFRFRQSRPVSIFTNLES
jgi:hypothetical protein